MTQPQQSHLTRMINLQYSFMVLRYDTIASNQGVKIIR